MGDDRDGALNGVQDPWQPVGMVIVTVGKENRRHPVQGLAEDLEIVKDGFGSGVGVEQDVFLGLAGRQLQQRREAEAADKGRVKLDRILGNDEDVPSRQLTKSLMMLFNLALEYMVPGRPRIPPAVPRVPRARAPIRTSNNGCRLRAPRRRRIQGRKPSGPRPSVSR